MSRLGALVVAAGSSRRMGFDKLTSLLAGRPLVAWTLEAFERCPEVGPSVLVCAEDRAAEFRGLASEFSKFSCVVAGGRERPDSVLNGLKAFPAPHPEYVAVQDGARPLTTPAAISACFASAAAHGAAVCAERETDTLHRVDDTMHAIETVSRWNLWRMQTPQIARYEILRELFERLTENPGDLTDEISLLLRNGSSAVVVENADWNFKVTYPRDLLLAEAVLNSRIP